MTIAAGFCYKGGVLLCCDSQFTQGNSKLDGVKFGSFEGSWGKAIAVCAGNVDFATAAFQEIERRQEYKDFKDDPISILAATLEDYYRRHVLSHPFYANGAMDFDTLWGVYLASEKKAMLFRQHETAFRRLLVFDCIGAGGQIARDVVRYLYQKVMPIEAATAIGSYAISQAKHRAQYCGGKTIMGAVSDSGEGLTEDQTRSLNKISYHMETAGPWFTWKCEQFLIQQCGADDATFERQLEALRSVALHLRKVWTTLVLPNHQSTTDDQIYPQPSPESPEGTDES